MDHTSLVDIANAMVQKGKGILAADESTPTCKKRFDSINVESTEENRNKYRNMLFTADGIENYISGVILFDETLRQSTMESGVPFPDYLTKLGILPGIKVDKGAKQLANTGNEKITEGLDGLRDRLKEYYELGARFTKWRAVITIGENMPTAYCMSANAHALARYAALCQEQGLVPIVEPEILMDGTHTIDESYQLTTETLYNVFYELVSQGVELEGMVLKPNMVLSGYDCSEQASVEQVAEMTVGCFLNTVPAAVPGIAFLSGGQSDELASAHLNAMNQIDNTPWNITFSYGRALQSPALKAWSGEDENVSSAQDALMKRAKFNSLATKGEFSADMEN
ncbi:MAG: class I fructose-bisphosphate aldolase [Candidatus Neomarinimicrobiota bacterium]|nr:class I fructose-bisphosphate aldolase [Candidatus Neomarinimicrobiota bacterium]